ncbi:hypothetical protein [Microbulbifer hydrolyticus]|uniref:DUF4304 domain-containing protein n=1 Tax=Microbulbifer hydrolyticus TaxID=48074 RepID=A0A6P1TDF5_9GAMM|nr:hypothetical protein [Microbulbifer hydrolyticus]MBB5212000.1 hypothetical protein [Microbulbifer hydrolyticus]QHQ39683.1 hypothetical protein GTQ55_12260 [Microbulbifer hydrolyticus]
MKNMSALTRISKDLVGHGFSKTVNKYYKVVEYSRPIVAGATFLILVFETKKGLISVDVGVRIEAVERCLERYESEQMAMSGFGHVSVLSRPTFYKKVFDGPTSDFDVEDLHDEFQPFFDPVGVDDGVVKGFLDRMICHSCPAEFPDGCSVYLAKRLLIFLYLSGRCGEVDLEVMAENIDGAKAYAEDIVRLRNWLEVNVVDGFLL